MVTISSALLRDLRSHGLAPRSEDTTLVVHDAADKPRDVPAREHLLADSTDAFQIGYVGNLYPGRGVELIAAIAKGMPDVRFHIVGGSTSDLARWERSETPSNLTLHGFVPPSRVPGILREFDAVLMPHQRVVLAATGRSDISRWTSPLKMFEYMASGTPIIASRLPVLQEILEDGRNALLAEPDDIPGWIRAVRRLEGDAGLRNRLSREAYHDFITEHTWQRRADKVLWGLERPGKTGRSPQSLQDIRIQ
jgi:glycosyltransferase involved in cell wall biosynthesis